MESPHAWEVRIIENPHTNHAQTHALLSPSRSALSVIKLHTCPKELHFFSLINTLPRSFSLSLSLSVCLSVCLFVSLSLSLSLSLSVSLTLSLSLSLFSHISALLSKKGGFYLDFFRVCFHSHCVSWEDKRKLCWTQQILLAQKWVSLGRQTTIVPNSTLKIASQW